MADRGALSEVLVLAFLQEATKLRGTGSSPFSPRGISGAKPAASENAIKAKNDLSSRKRRRQNYVGEKSYALSGYCSMGDTFQEDWDKVLMAALGGKLVDSSITATSNRTASGFEYTGGPPAPIVLAELSNGVKMALPVSSYVAGTPNSATFGLQPDLTGGVTISSVKNPLDTTGVLYYVDPTANTQSFQIQSKHADEPDNRTLIGLGCTVSKFMLKTALQDVLGIDFEFQGVDWYPGAGTYGGVTYTDQTADQGLATNEFLSHMGVVYCQDITPATVVDVEASGIEFDMAPTHVERRAIMPRMPNSTDSVGSSVASKRFGIHFENEISLNFQFYNQSTWDDRRRSQTQLQLFFEFFNGAPQGTATKRIAGWFPSVYVSQQPEETEEGGLVGQGVKLQVEERTLTGIGTSPFYLAFFGE